MLQLFLKVGINKPVSVAYSDFFFLIYINDHSCMALYTQIINLNGSRVWEIYENKTGWGNSTSNWAILHETL